MRIGLLGFGGMGRTHAYAVANLPFFYRDLPFTARIHGVCTKNPENARVAAQTYGFPVAAQNEDELIASPDIDVIDICTPNIYHYETLRKALRAKKHVYCEKPLCVSEEQAWEIASLAEEMGVTAGVVFNNRFLDRQRPPGADHQLPRGILSQQCGGYRQARGMEAESGHLRRRCSV